MKSVARACLLVGIAVAMRAQDPDAAPAAPAVLPVQPLRLELGGYGDYFQNAGGWWRGFDSTLWIRKSPKFVPALTFDSRTSNAGTERYYSFFSYANWTPNFFTTQAVAGTPDGGTATLPLLFPRLRYDAKAWWKLPPHRRAVAGLGFTRYTLDNRLSGTIINPGLLYYTGPLVFDLEGFVNRTEPGSFWSGSGLLAVQQGREGNHWVGVSVGAGRQTYRELMNLPLAVRFASVSVDTFYRKWLTRNFGVVVSAGYFDAFHTYQRFLVTGHIFFEF